MPGLIGQRQLDLHVGQRAHESRALGLRLVRSSWIAWVCSTFSATSFAVWWRGMVAAGCRCSSRLRRRGATARLSASAQDRIKNDVLHTHSSINAGKWFGRQRQVGDRQRRQRQARPRRQVRSAPGIDDQSFRRRNRAAGCELVIRDRSTIVRRIVLRAFYGRSPEVRRWFVRSFDAGSAIASRHVGTFRP